MKNGMDLSRMLNYKPGSDRIQWHRGSEILNHLPLPTLLLSIVYSIISAVINLNFPVFCCFVSIARLKRKPLYFSKAIKITEWERLQLTLNWGYSKMIYCCWWTKSTDVWLRLCCMCHSHQCITCGLCLMANLQVCLPCAKYANHAKQEGKLITQK